MLVTVAFTWRAIRRGQSPLPWMCLALFMFSMTTYWPLFYLYFDVFLLFAASALAESVGDSRAIAFGPWLVTLAGLICVVFLGLRTGAEVFPSIDMSTVESMRSQFEGVDGHRDDGDKEVAAISGPRAVFALPRASRSAATVVIDARTLDGPPQSVAAILNGKLLGSAESDDRRQTLRFPAARSAWWIGYNRLELVFSEHHPTLGVSRIGVEP